MSFDSEFNVEKIKSDIFSNVWEIAPEVIDFEKALNYYSINVSNKGESPPEILVVNALNFSRLIPRSLLGKNSNLHFLMKMIL